MFTTIPADLSGLSADEIKALLATSRSEVEAARAAHTSGEHKLSKGELAEANAAKARWPELQAKLDELDAAEDADDDDVDALGEPEAEDETSEPEGEHTTTTTPEPTPARGANPALESDTTPPPAANTSGAGRLITTSESMKGGAGRVLESPEKIAAELISAALAGSGTGRRTNVAVAQGVFSDTARLRPDGTLNLEGLTMAEIEREITAALDADPTPTYDMDGYSITSRPVAGSLATRQAPRGGFTVYPSPTMADIATNAVGNAVDIWTSTDDVTPASVKGYTTISAGTSTRYEIYAVHRAMRVKEMLLRTFPELVAIFVNKLEAVFARTAEVQLLQAMYADTTAYGDIDTQAYGATVSIMRRLETLAALHRDSERWADDQAFDVYGPRWLQSGLRLDQMSRRSSSQGVVVPSVGEIQRQFGELNARYIPVLDRASYMTAFNAVSNGATPAKLNRLPTTVNLMVVPRGKFVRMDRGDLTVGTIGSPQRDTALVEKNEAQIFYEAFEGVLRTSNIPAYTITVGGLRFTGQQIADIEMDANGVAV
ncbi:MAG: major capsid protein [Ilumatobacter sp.]|nr:major capsid protein [Ilumatobacter sp.]